MNGSMADTTNDIWNDNDGEEDEAPRKGGRPRAAPAAGSSGR